MARLWSCGFELNSAANNVEFSISGLPSIVSNPVRTGSYAGRANPSASVQRFKYTLSLSGINIVFCRFYVRISTPPASDSTIAYLEGTGDVLFGIRLTSDNKLRLYDEFNGVNIGSASAALVTGEWHRVELYTDITTDTSTVGIARLDGTEFARGTADFSGIGPIAVFSMGPVTSSTYDVYYDDVAINDNLGSYQNSWPGDGRIIHIRPTSNSSFQWLKETGDPGDANNYQKIDDTPPDDGNSFIKSNTFGHVDYYNRFETTNLSQNCFVNLVSLGVRFQGSGASANSTCTFDIATLTDATGIITPDSTTWRTNANSAPFTYPITMYKNDTVDIEHNDINDMQVQIEITTGNTNFFQISTLWILVDYTERQDDPKLESVVSNPAIRVINKVVGY